MNLLDRITPLARYRLKRDYQNLTPPNQRKLRRYARLLAKDARRDTRPLRTKGATGPLA